MIKYRSVAVALSFIAALAFTACTPLSPPIPTAQTDQVRVGMQISQVFEILGVSIDQLDDAGGPDPFTIPNDPSGDPRYIHDEINWVFRGVNGECQQTINMQFKNYIDVPFVFHNHLDFYTLTNYDVTLSSGCNGVVK